MNGPAHVRDGLFSVQVGSECPVSPERGNYGRARRRTPRSAWKTLEIVDGLLKLIFGEDGSVTTKE